MSEGRNKFSSQFGRFTYVFHSGCLVVPKTRAFVNSPFFCFYIDIVIVSLLFKGGIMTNLKQSWFLMLLSIVFFSCSGPRTIILDVTAKTTRINPEKAFNAVTSVLIDEGFDIKVGNKDLGLISTEYKQFASIDTYGSPPFDLYLQIKVRIKQGNDRRLHIILTPMAKDVNRLNAAAFSEHELIILTEEEQSGYMNIHERAYLKGQVLFLNVVQGIAELTGLGMEELEYNTMLRDF